jgi:trehalose utilization protein
MKYRFKVGTIIYFSPGDDEYYKIIVTQVSTVCIRARWPDGVQVDIPFNSNYFWDRATVCCSIADCED